MRKCIIGLGLAAALICTFGAFAKASDDEANAKQPAPASDDARQRIAELIGRLDDKDFAVRDEATKALIGLGRDAAEPVGAAAETGGLEVATRCLSVLSALFTSTDEATRASARRVLERLAEGKSRSLVRRAKKILSPPAANDAPALPGVPIRGGGRLHVRTRTTNGQTEVDVDDNGTKVHITHAGGRDITVTITPPPPQNGAGQDAPEKTVVQAAEAGELQKKNPEAAQYYERYGTGRPIGGPFGAGPFGGGPFGNGPHGFPAPLLPPRILAPRPVLPGLPAGPPVFEPPLPKKPAPAVAGTGQELQRMIERLKELGANDDVDPERLAKLAAEIQALAERLAAAKKGGGK